MKSKEVNSSSEEVISLDGHTVILRYAETSVPKVLENIQDTLFNQKTTPTRSSIFCNQANNVR